MVRIDKGPAPHGMGPVAKKLLSDYHVINAKKPSLTISKYWADVRSKLDPFVDVLKERSHSKCAYCESKIGSTAHPHVEHYKPKMRFEALTFAWTNWLLSCGVCNQTKWSHFPMCGPVPCLIDPASEDPTGHVDFAGVFPVGLTPRGEKTIELTSIDRSSLETERSLWLSRVDFLLLLMLNPASRAAARDLLLWALKPSAPYSSMTRAYLLDVAPKLALSPAASPAMTLDDAELQIRDLAHSFGASLPGGAS